MLAEISERKAAKLTARPPGFYLQRKTCTAKFRTKDKRKPGVSAGFSLKPQVRID